ncbi:virulence factor [Oceanibacterium hippocampi]|uniref:Virulence factor domain-containing protein n=1 Tax=Oceanibacterium hippocampi TaxID=745714 RepID=A0A1Y5U270_9PROT|nr:virulence factor [Oceanibacterium hippocampi]SLN77185.1 hypothetical protein OCH7691_04323 [Oceanibacterium hippocampi]
MGTLTVLYWRDIPAQVIARAGRNKVGRQLDERFEKAIDRAAMRSKTRDSDAYLAEWRRSDGEPCGDDLEQAVAARVAEIEAAFDDARLDELVAAGGHAGVDDGTG